MLKFLREWGFPVGLLALWGIAAAYTLYALGGGQPAQLPVMVAPAVVIVVPRPMHS
jgi:hypothetical protein